VHIFFKGNFMNIIIPAAGRSSRYKSEKPKYLLTHPSGSLMIEIVFKSIIKRLNRCYFYIIILLEHDQKFNASMVLRQVALANNIDLNITIIDEVTNGPAETVFECIRRTNISGSFLIKDADNVIDFDPTIVNFEGCDGFLVGGDVALHNVVDIHQKSFITATSDSRVTSFVEKRIVSNIVCFGLYGFSDSSFFNKYFVKVSSLKYDGEIFVSHLVQAALLDGKTFYFREAISLSDWGIWSQWMLERRRLRTFFIDFDGVLVKNGGQYGNPNWDSDFRSIDTNINMLKQISDVGSQILITTSRPEKYKERLDDFFISHGIKIFKYIFGLNHSERILLNDYSDSNPYPSASALNLLRDGDLSIFSDVLQ